MGAAAREREDATSPRRATTRFWLMSFVAAVAASSGLLWSSSVRTLSFLPSTPPAALTSSKASRMPLWVDCPKVAVPPVSELYSPTRISLLAAPPPAPPPAPPDPPPQAIRARAAAVASKARDVMLILRFTRPIKSRFRGSGRATVRSGRHVKMPHPARDAGRPDQPRRLGAPCLVPVQPTR